MPTLISSHEVRTVMIDCLWPDEDIASLDRDAFKAQSIIVNGITAKFGFKPNAVKRYEARIKSWLQHLNPAFTNPRLGGWSFLQLCMDKDDNLWGQHVDCEALMVLAMAVRCCMYLLPRDIWSALPGGMPYLFFNPEGFPADQELPDVVFPV